MNTALIIAIMILTVVNIVISSKLQRDYRLHEMNITNLQSAELYVRTRLSKLEQDVFECQTNQLKLTPVKKKRGRPRKNAPEPHELRRSTGTIHSPNGKQ